ncbi:multi-sensor hybrid histidine kinase [Methylobacterium sp. 4-46]|nr:multi-sensor hybrid histidine kinase [Methylobacterium sp. 4-46]
MAGRRPRPLSYSIVALTLVLLIPSVAISGLLAWRWVAAEQQRLESATVAINAYAVAQVDRFLSGQIAMLQALATSPALDTGDLARFDAQARELVTLQGVNIILRGRDGQQLINTRLPYGTALPNLLRDIDRNVLESGKPTVSDLFVGAVSGEPMIRVGVPVTRGGRIAYLLSASYSAALFGQLLADAGVAAPYSGSITDRTGTIIGRSVDSANATGRPLPGFAAVKGQRGTWSGRNLLGVPVFATYQRSGVAGWLVSIGIERSALQEPLTDSLSVLVPIIAALMFVALVASAMVGRRIVAAQHRLAEAARALGSGEAIPVPRSSFSEVDEVGAALAVASARLRDQADALRAINRDLEQMVERRTREVAAQQVLLSTTLDAMDQGLVMIDGRGTVAVANRRAAELLGLASDALVGAPHARVPDLLRAAWSEAEPGGAHAGPAPLAERTLPDGRVLEIRSTWLPEGGVVCTCTDVTARRSAEAALHEKTALLDATLAHMDQGVLVIDQDGIVQLCNERALALLDLPAAFATEKPSFAALVAYQQRTGEFSGATEDHDPWLKLKGDLLGAPKVYERSRPNGTVIEVRTVRLASGGAIRTFSDVTAHRQRERAIGLSEARYRALAEALPQLVWTVRPDTREALYRNAQFDRYYGPISNAVADRLAHNHPADSARMAEAWARAERASEPLTVEGRLRRHDGVYRWHRLVMVPLLTQGVITEWLGTALDIDDIITAQEQVRQSKDLLQLAQTAAGAGVWEWDMQAGLVLLSRVSARRYGLEVDAADAVVTLTSQEWTRLLHPEDAGRVWEAVHEAVATRQNYAVTFRPAARGGGGAVECWIEGHGRIMRNGSGAPVRIVGLDFDVTPRMRAERALKQATRLAEQAREEAEAASTAKSEFLAMMSHEIRTPLHGILGYADLLTECGLLAAEQQRQVEHIRTAGRALLAVVNDVLDFSAIEAGRVALDPRPFALRALIGEVVAIVREPAERKGLTLAAEIDPAVPDWLVGDQGRVRQVLLNLAANAQKFCHAGSVTLSVAPDRIAAEALTVRFAVRDTGVGIEEDKLGRLFQRFSQADGSIRREFGGTGLGLAISKALVEAMGGRIGVESVPGRGSTFWFTLRLLRAAPPLPLAPERDPKLARPARILLADDSDINRDIASRVLEAAGHAVVAVPHGEAAVEATAAGGFDIVLMDVQMPVVDGLTATRRIRTLSGAAGRLPIIAMTANVLPSQIAEFRAAGMDDHIGKPFRQKDLLAVVQRWTGAGGASPEPVSAGEAGRLGPDALRALRARLAADLRSRFSPDLAHDRLAREAHEIVSLAGLLGFPALAEVCREVERACDARRDLDDVLARLMQARDATLAEIERAQVA